MSDVTGEEAPTGSTPPRLLPADDQRTALRLTLSLASRLSAPWWIREGFLLGGIYLLLFLPVGPLTPVGLVLLVLSFALARRRVQAVQVLLPYLMASVECFGPASAHALVQVQQEGSPLARALTMTPERAEETFLTSLRSTLLRRPEFTDCSEGHSLGCMHRPLVPRPPAPWWPERFTATVGAVDE